jgi:hypothetical protein
MDGNTPSRIRKGVPGIVAVLLTTSCSGWLCLVLEYKSGLFLTANQVSSGMRPAELDDPASDRAQLQQQVSDAQRTANRALEQTSQIIAEAREAKRVADEAKAQTRVVFILVVLNLFMLGLVITYRHRYAARAISPIVTNTSDPSAFARRNASSIFGSDTVSTFGHESDQRSDPLSFCLAAVQARRSRPG